MNIMLSRDIIVVAKNPTKTHSGERKIKNNSCSITITAQKNKRLHSIYIENVLYLIRITMSLGHFESHATWRCWKGLQFCLKIVYYVNLSECNCFGNACYSLKCVE
jgi:hypothetical protein